MRLFIFFFQNQYLICYPYYRENLFRKKDKNATEHKNWNNEFAKGV